MEQYTCGERPAADRQDYQQYDRIWQRVSPELNPYPDVREEGQSTQGMAARTEGMSTRMEELPGSFPDPCCMGNSAQQSLEVIRGFIDQECYHCARYKAQARRQCRPERVALLQRMAEISMIHIRRLMTACYLITGQCCRPSVQSVELLEMSWCQMLREFYHDEICDSFNYRRAGDEVTDPCLSRLFAELADSAQRQADELFAQLSRMMCRQSRWNSGC